MSGYNYKPDAMCWLFGFVLLFCSVFAYAVHADQLVAPGLTAGFMTSGFVFLAIGILIDFLKKALRTEEERPKIQPLKNP